MHTSDYDHEFINKIDVIKEKSFKNQKSDVYYKSKVLNKNFLI